MSLQLVLHFVNDTLKVCIKYLFDTFKSWDWISEVNPYLQSIEYISANFLIN